MSDQKKSNDGLNDADLKHLFDQQTSEPPKALDELILGAAKASETAIPVAVKPTPFLNRYSAGFGLAAMVLLGVLIVPLMTNQPEYTLDVNSSSNKEPVAMLVDSAEEAVTEKQEQPTGAEDLTAGFSIELDASGGGDAGDTMASVSALSIEPSMKAKPVQKSAQAQPESIAARVASESVARPSALVRPEVISSEIEAQERESPLKWIQAIKRLYEQNNPKRAKSELDKFRLQHPNSEHEALLPRMLREHENAE